MDVFYNDVIQYLQEKETTIDDLQKEYHEMEEIKKKPSQEYIREVNAMNEREKYNQMKFEQQINLLINMKQMSPKNDIYLNTKCLNDAIKMYQQIHKMQEQIQE